MYKILIVDDQVENLKIVVSFLQTHQCRYELLQSNLAVKALAIAKDTLPDLIIADWDMPEMNGIELIEALKADSSTCNIPVVMATGAIVASQSLMLALNAGAIDYIRKPIDPVELQARVHSALTISAYHKKALEAKNRELAGYMLTMVKNNKLCDNIRQQLANTLHVEINDQRVLIKQMLGLLNEHLRTCEFEKFEMVFAEVYPMFIKNLLARFPILTGGEMKMCIYIRLGMSIKDIAGLMNISPESVKVARSRLRKKLDLEISDNLMTFLLAV